MATAIVSANQLGSLKIRSLELSCSEVAEEVLPTSRPFSVRQEEILELTKAPTALYPHIAACDFISESRQHSAFVGSAIAGAMGPDKRAEA